MIGKKYFLFLGLTTVFFTSCQTYTVQNSDIRKEMYSNNIPKAIENINKSSLATENRNFALFRMEKGMLLYLNQQYDAATKLWIEADHRLDELYTTSISNTAASLAINDSLTDYNGEAHERVLLPIFSSMAFFAENNINNAQVMIRRSYDITNTLQSQKEGKNTFKYDAFSHYFAGFVYETKQDWDNAIVEYRLALNNLVDQTPLDKKQNIIVRTEIYKALGRLATYRNRTDVLSIIKKENPKLTWTNENTVLQKGEVFIVYECGKSPIKVTKSITIPVEGITTASISIPTYEVLPYQSHFANIFMNNTFIDKTIIMENIGQMAQEALNDRRAGDIAKMSARVIAKTLAAREAGKDNDLAGLAFDFFNKETEVADTRSWTSLPDTIQIARIIVDANKETTIEIRPQADAIQKFSVTMMPGEKKLFRFRTFN